MGKVPVERYEGIVCPEAGLAAVIVSYGYKAVQSMPDISNTSGRFC